MTRSTALILCLLALLGGCTALPKTVAMPPSELLQDCRTGSLSFKTNEEVSLSVSKLAAALTQCNIDKAGLRAWRKDYE